MASIVLDGDLKSALSAVRSLGKTGEFVVAAAERRTAMALHSKYTKESFVYTSPKLDQEKFVAEIKAQARVLLDETGEKPVVFCFSDATHLSLARAISELKEVLLFPLPPYEPLEVAFDKEKTYISGRLGTCVRLRRGCYRNDIKYKYQKYQ